MRPFLSILDISRSSPEEDEYESYKHATEVSEMADAIVGTHDTGNELNGSIADDKPFGFDGHKEIEVDAFVGEHHTKSQQDSVYGARGTYRWHTDDSIVVDLHDGLGGLIAEIARGTATPCVGDAGNPFGSDDVFEVFVVELQQSVGRGIGSVCVDGIESDGRGDPHEESMHQTGTDSAQQVIDNETFGAPEILKNISEHPQCEHVEENMLEVAMHEHIGDVLPRVEVVAAYIVEGKPLVEVDIQRCAENHRCQIEYHINDNQMFHS